MNNYIKYPKNFAELEDPLSNYDASKVIILPVPYEKTTTYIKGTANGPGAIIYASRNMELYDEELNKEICKIGICTLNELRIDEKPELMVNIVYQNVKKIINDDKFIITLGGEHSITPGAIKAFAEKYGDFSILQLDAHSDLREEYDNTKFSHACAMKRCRDIIKNIVQVGIRSLDYEEAVLIKKNKFDIFWAKDIYDNDEWFDEAISKLSKNVYITIDLDVFDPSIMPSVGTPEPGGLKYYQILRFLRRLCEKKNVLGFDVMELCPNKDNASSDFTAAKIAYKLIGYVFDKSIKK
ncbi:agmatinase [archaeon]|jgi:agmatinase|nr:agmatinase [archaeon]MDP6547968.1 agmatinase [Candidatus Woesearchaeota archaeon]|tara:strand:- start:73566 stop:74453 length:888 start_codon:yes stop_codon:yes gene_type:complete